MIHSRSIKFIILLALIGAGGFWGIKKARQIRAEKAESKDTLLGAVEKKDLIQRVTIAGYVTPARKTIVTAPYTGYVQNILVKQGQMVKKGDPLVKVSQDLQSQEPIFPLRAPFSGIVVHVNKAEGEYVREKDLTDYILRIDDMSKLFIMADAAEIDRAKIKLNQEALVKASAILDRTYKAAIRDLSLAARDRTSGRSQVEFPIRLEVLDPDEKLRPGMSVIMDIITDKRDNVLTLRHEFLYRDGNRYYVITENGERKDVKVGMQNEEASEITDGISEGEKTRQVDFASLKTESGYL